MLIKRVRVIKQKPIENSAMTELAKEEQIDEAKEVIKSFRNLRPISDLFGIADNIQSLCTDGVFHSSLIHSGGDKEIYFNKHTGSVIPMSDHSFSQLCGKLEVPVRFMNKCIDKEYTELVRDTIDTHLRDLNKDLFIRQYDGKVRGVLSDRYAVLDTPDILRVLDQTIGDSYQVKSYFMNEERFQARLISPHMLDIEGEDLFAGIQIDSSDVGRNTLTCKFFIYKQVCTNGMTRSIDDGLLFSQKHIGITAEEFEKGLKKGLDCVEPLVAKFVEAIKENKVNLTKNGRESIIAKIVADLKLSEDTVKQIDNIIDIQKYGNPSRWAVINSLTEIAQQFTLDRRSEIEEYAGNMLKIA